MRRAITKTAIPLALALTLAQAQARDAFDEVGCAGIVANALVGKRLDNAPVEAIEKKHAALELEHEGSEALSDSLQYEDWRICGHAYHLIVQDDVIRAVVRADHSRSAPAFLGACEANGRPAPEPLLAILAPPAPLEGHAPANDRTRIPAARAWRIDAQHARFVEIDAAGLECPREGVSSADGGP